MTDRYTQTINTLRGSLNLDYELDKKILDILPKLIEARARYWTKGNHGYFTGSYSDGKSGGTPNCSGGIGVISDNGAKLSTSGQKVLTNDSGGGIIKAEKDLSGYIGAPIIERDNLHIREWYYANVHNIPNIIDNELPFEQQVMQAYNLRNRFKHEARAAMMDFETLRILEKERPVKSFEELLNEKMKRKGLSKDEALEDILKTASKTNSEVDDLFKL